MASQLQEIERRFGLTLRTHQAEAIEASLRGEDVALHLPTGGGKSLVFQGLSHVLPRMTVVVYPLRALVKDQERRLELLQLPGVAYYGATKTSARQSILERIVSGALNLILTTPETLLHNQRLLQAIANRGISLLVIDEAHVYEEWAETFRPAYMKLAACVQALGPERLMICSATLTAWGLANATRALSASRWTLVQAPAIRPNLSYVNMPTRFRQEIGRGGYVRNRWFQTDEETLGGGTGIAFFAWVSTLREVAPEGALVYHGDLRAKARKLNQEAWMTEARWMYATKAFGMGIDKDDVRAIAHFQLPDSVLSYAQEAGRAGRDGKPAECRLDPAEGGQAAAFLLDITIPPPDVLWPVFDHYRRRVVGDDGWILLEAKDTADKLRMTEPQLRAAVVWLGVGGFFQRATPPEHWTFTLAPERTQLFVDESSMVEVLRRELHGTDGRITRDDLDEALWDFDNWERELDKLVRAGQLAYTKPGRHVAKLRVLRGNANRDDLVLLERRCAQVRARALGRLDEMRRLADAPPAARPAMIERAITLDPGQVAALMGADAAPRRMIVTPEQPSAPLPPTPPNHDEPSVIF